MTIQMQNLKDKEVLGQVEGAARVKNTGSQWARCLHVEMPGIQDENLGGNWNVDVLYSNHTPWAPWEQHTQDPGTQEEGL